MEPTDTKTAGIPHRADPLAARQRHTGLALAGITAVVSGFSVFVNGYGVGHFDDPTTYTTAKNIVAAGLVFAVWSATSAQRRKRIGGSPVESGENLSLRRRVVALSSIAVIGGSAPFVLFFEGLSRTNSTDAAFIHKTLLAWVAVLAVFFLAERVGRLQVLAIGIILFGYAITQGGVGLPEIGLGEAMIFGATLCWSVEVVLAKFVLRGGVDELVVSTSRMLGGVVVLIVWAAARGAMRDLIELSAQQWSWALITGTLLCAYVISWHFALARAQAVDVTAILVFGAVITALLNAGVRDLAVQPLGLMLLAAGGFLIVAGSLRPKPQPRST